MNFPQFWNNLQERLKAEDEIENWTVYSGYLGDRFKVISVSGTEVIVKPPNAKNCQRVSKEDFKITFDNWEAYYSGELRRPALRDMTRFSKYTISIIKHLLASQ